MDHGRVDGQKSLRGVSLESSQVPGVTSFSSRSYTCGSRWKALFFEIVPDHFKDIVGRGQGRCSWFDEMIEFFISNYFLGTDASPFIVIIERMWFDEYLHLVGLKSNRTFQKSCFLK